MLCEEPEKQNNILGLKLKQQKYTEVKSNAAGIIFFFWSHNQESWLWEAFSFIDRHVIAPLIKLLCYPSFLSRWFKSNKTQTKPIFDAVQQRQAIRFGDRRELLKPESYKAAVCRHVKMSERQTARQWLVF